MPYFLKRQNFFTILSLLMAVKYFISFAFAIVLSLHCFCYLFFSCWCATFLFSIVLDGVFILSGFKFFIAQYRGKNHHQFVVVHLPFCFLINKSVYPLDSPDESGKNLTITDLGSQR